MNKLYLTIVLAFIFIGGISSSLISFSSGAPAGRAGSPISNGNTCATAGCHASFPLNSGTGTLQVTTDIPADGFIAGNTYKVDIAMVEAGITRFAFESVPYGENTMGSAGNITISDAMRTKTVNGGANTFVTHTFNGISGNAASTWSYDWTPNADDDSVTFYASGMASNNNGSTAGDRIYNVSTGARRQFGVSITPEKNIASLKAFPSPASQNLFVSFESRVSEPTSIVLLDLQGREVYRYEDYLKPGEFSNVINVNNFPTGIYTLRVRMGKEVASRKVVVE
ncbi:MAG: T9SS type A sorting domain-containing protein [Bacteroidia bacterium]